RPIGPGREAGGVDTVPPPPACGDRAPERETGVGERQRGAPPHGQGERLRPGVAPARSLRVEQDNRVRRTPLRPKLPGDLDGYLPSERIAREPQRPRRPY